MTKTDKPQPKRAQPETMREAQVWEGVKRRYLAFGLCHVCASQAAWGHQIGFANVHPPCGACSEAIATLPRVRPNGWRTPLTGKRGILSPGVWSEQAKSGARHGDAVPGAASAGTHGASHAEHVSESGIPA